jgi:membrane protein required for colicin V production
LNIVDVILGINIISLSYLGFKKGFLASIFSLAGIVAGLILAVKFHIFLNPILKPFLSSAQLIDLISFLIVLILTYYISVFIASRISRINKVTKTMDRIAGTVLGFVKGIIIASLLAIVFSNFNIFSDVTLKKSFLYSEVENIAPDLYNYLNNFISTDKSAKDLKNLLLKDTLNKK